MKNNRRGKKRSALSRFLERLDDFNPFCRTLLAWLLAAGVTVGVIALLVRARHAGVSVASSLSLLVAGPVSVGLTASILNFLGFEEYKKDHPGKRLDKQSYIRMRKKAQSNFEERYRAIGNMHRRR